MILAEKITEERKKNGWSQEELAAKLGGIPAGCFKMGERRVYSGITEDHSAGGAV